MDISLNLVIVRISALLIVRLTGRGDSCGMRSCRSAFEGPIVGWCVSFAISSIIGPVKSVAMLRYSRF